LIKQLKSKKLTKNVFITGGAGQDGQILTILLQKKKINLTIFYKDKIPKNIKGVNFIKEDLLNKKKIDTLFKKIKPNMVKHHTKTPSPQGNNWRYKIK